MENSKAYRLKFRSRSKKEKGRNKIRNSEKAQRARLSHLNWGPGKATEATEATQTSFID